MEQTQTRIGVGVPLGRIIFQTRLLFPEAHEFGWRLSDSRSCESNRDCWRTVGREWFCWPNGSPVGYDDLLWVVGCPEHDRQGYRRYNNARFFESWDEVAVALDRIEEERGSDE